MPKKDAYYFQLLKKEIVKVMRISHPGITGDISSWKGQEITDFQEDLARKVSEHISEKWFYTHMKGEHGTLPRVDILNFLSKYAGYNNWDEFRHFKSKESGNKYASMRPGTYFILLPILTLLLLIVFYSAYKAYSTREYEFCFYDRVSGLKIENNLIEVSLLRQGESPEKFLCEVNGCVKIKTDLSSIKLAINAPYYLPDTIQRNLNRNQRMEIVYLQENDYARIIHDYSRSELPERQKRRAQLESMISDKALIYKTTAEKDTGFEMFDKEEFITMLLDGSGEDEHIEILETKFRNDQIIILRFRLVDARQAGQ